jgi:hypothetical protein
MANNIDNIHGRQRLTVLVESKDCRATGMPGSLRTAPSQEAVHHESNLRFRKMTRKSDLLMQRKLLLSWLGAQLRTRGLLNEAWKQPNGTKVAASEPIDRMSSRDTLCLASQKNIQNPFQEQFPELNTEEEVKGEVQGLATLGHALEMTSYYKEYFGTSIMQDIRGQENRLYTKEGSYLVCNLLAKSAAFFWHLELYCLSNLRSLSLEDYSCRVLRAVLRRSDIVKQKILLEFRTDFDFCLKNFHPIFLLTEAIKHASNPQDFDFIVEILKKDTTNQVLSSKNFKRILLTLFQYCSTLQLESIERYMDLNRNLHLYLNDKVSANIVCSMIDRGSKACKSAFLKYAKQKTRILIELKLSHQFLVKMAESSASTTASGQIRKAFESLQTKIAKCQGASDRKSVEAAKDTSMMLLIEYCKLHVCRDNCSLNDIKTSLLFLIRPIGL